jgi:hypothetical protein
LTKNVDLLRETAELGSLSPSWGGLGGGVLNPKPLTLNPEH